jgi:1A family penicillin-binding protein
MRLSRKKKLYRRRARGQVFYEFPGANTLGLTVTKLPVVELPAIGSFGKKKVALWSTRFLLVVAGLLLSATALGGAVFGYYWATTPSVPPLSALVNKQFRGATIYDRNGVELFNMGSGATHKTVKLSDVPKPLVEATIATEDANFYNHHGIDLVGIARAAINDLEHKQSLQGGSTITQQLVKNTILSNERSFGRKFKEAVMASKMEHSYTKQDILTVYFNQIFYGQHAWGVADAAQNYFNEPVQKLNLAQSSMLAGIPAAPTVFSPLGEYPQLSKVRQSYVLDRMVKLGYIKNSAAQLASDETLAYHPAENQLLAPHFVSYVRDLLSKQYSEKQMEQDGFRIYTTLDITKQNLAQQLVTQQVQNLAGQNVHNGALIAINPKNGQILSMVGSADYNNDSIGGKYNDSLALRQPGSALKPFNYLTAFEKGLTAATITHDQKTNFGGGYTPKDYDGKYRGNISIRQALQNSLNIPAVEVLRFNGLPSFISTLQAFGITTLNAPLNNYGLSLTLGGGDVTLLDLTSSYGVLANQGARYEPQAILKIVDGSGKIIVDNSSTTPGSQVVTPQLAYYVTNILSDNNARAMEFGINNSLHLSDRPSAAKTGTTDDFRDAWTFGYTPDLVVGTWVGNNNNAPMGAVAGALGAAPIWHDFMAQALAGTPASQFNQPSGISTRYVSRTTGLPLPNGQRSDYQEIFIDGITPVALTDTSTPDQPQPQATPAPEATTPAPDNNAPTVPTPSPDPTSNNPAKPVGVTP